jgi:integrase
MPEYRIVKHRGKWSLAYTDERRGRIRIALGTDDRGRAESVARDIWRARNQPASEKVADLWLPYAADRKATVVRADRFDDVWKPLAPHFGHRLGKAISREDCKAYHAARRRDGVSNSTAKTELEFLRACLRWHYKGEAPAIWLPPESKPRERYLTKAEVNAVLDGIETPHAKLFVIMAVTTGARMGALLDLKWDQVHWDTGTVDLNPAGREITNKRRTVVPLNSRAIEALAEAKRAARTDYVIEYADGPVKSVKKALAAASRRAGVPFSAHDLRRTAGVWMAEANVSMDKIAQFLGHTNPRLTVKHYARFSPSFMADAAAALEF